RATSTVAAMRIASRMTTVMPRPRTISVTAVAHASAARTKNCQGWSDRSAGVSASRRTWSVEVAELIVEPLLDGGIRSGGRRRRFLLVTGPAHRGEADDEHPARAERVRHEPGQPVEALVDRGVENLLAAVLLDEDLHDLIVRLALVDEVA